MENSIFFVLCIFTVIFLCLLCVATVVLIIKILRGPAINPFYFKKGTRLYNLAFKDDLTDLFNRNAYIRDLGEYKRKKSKALWLSIFDIDDFKTINDTHGHLFGDEVLISAAHRLCEIFDKKNNTVYRIGGDEFLVISEGISEDDLINLLLELKNIELKSADFRFSKGYSFVQNKGPETFDAAFDSADKMLYADKKSKKHQAPN